MFDLETMDGEKLEQALSMIEPSPISSNNSGEITQDSNSKFIQLMYNQILLKKETASDKLRLCVIAECLRTVKAIIAVEPYEKYSRQIEALKEMLVTTIS